MVACPVKKELRSMVKLAQMTGSKALLFLGTENVLGLLQRITGILILPVSSSSLIGIFLGDAAHSMSPMASRGGTTAVQTAAELTGLMSKKERVLLELKTARGVTLEGLSREQIHVAW